MAIIIQSLWTILLFLLVFLFGLGWMLASYYKKLTGDRLFFNPVLVGASPIDAVLTAHRTATRKGKYKAALTLKKKPCGIVFGKVDNLYACSTEAESGHVLAVGGTRSGKTSACLIPTIRAWHGSAFYIDISGDISANVPTDNTAIIDIAQGTGCYNIFAAVDAAAAPAQPVMLAQMAITIMPDVVTCSDSGAFFTANGRKMLTAALLHYYGQGLDFCDICQKFALQSTPELLSDIWQNGSTLAQSYISDFRGANEKNTAGCKQAAGDAIALFVSSTAVRSILHRPASGEQEVSPATIEKKSICISIAEDTLDLYAPVLALIAGQMLQYLSTRPPLTSAPVLLALDEFSRLGRLANIRGALATLAKRCVRIMLLTQSLADIDLMYGRDARKVICDNCASKLVLRATDPETQEYFSALIGKEPQQTYSHTWGTAGKSQSFRETFDYIIKPQEFGYLQDDAILICPTGYARLKKAYFFVDH